MTVLTPAELRFIDHLQKRNREAIGFLPHLALTEYNQRGQIIPATENDEICGYVLFYDGRKGNRPRLHPFTTKIHQVCISYDARLLYHATHIVNQIIDRAKSRGFHRIQAWVADDLPANDFWNAIGFTKSGRREGGRKRKRMHNLWTYDISQPSATLPYDNARHPYDDGHTSHGYGIRDDGRPLVPVRPLRT